MRHRIIVLILVCQFAGFAATGLQAESLPQMHPQVFSMVECWLSDLHEPVVTEINLDAVEQNGNQFFGKVYTDGEWTTVDVESPRKAFMRYRVLRREGDSWFVEFQNNRGGTLTTSSTIEFTLESRTFVIDREKKTVRVLRVQSIESNIQNGKYML
jgi:hypothetical protein